VSTLKCIGILAHPHRPQTAPVAEQVATSLQQHGIETWVHNSWDEADVIDDVRCADMLVAIGGDGAMLKAARVSAPYEVPVLGINMGRLGFLTEIAQPDEWETYLARIFEDDYWIEERMMLRVEIRRDDKTLHYREALNDVLISGNGVGHMVQLDLFINKSWATTYHADSLIVSTPTGSTAYALAVGGPILPPDLHNILIIPSAPHLSMERPIVLSEGSEVEVHALLDNRYEIVVVADGLALGQMQLDDTIHITASENRARFVRLKGRNYFYRSLLERLEPRVKRNTYQTEAEIPPVQEKENDNTAE